MKTATKKIIAREFLFLIAAIVLGLVIAFILHHIRNNYAENLRHKDEEYRSLVELKNMPFILYFGHFLNEYGHERTEYWNDADKFISKVRGEEKIEIYNQLLEHGVKFVAVEGSSPYDQFLKGVNEDNSSEQYLASIKSNITERVKLHDLGQEIGRALDMICTYLIILFFGLRYLIYATIWSIRTLKT